MSFEHTAGTGERKNSLSKQARADIIDSEKASHNETPDIRGAAPIKGDDSDGRENWTRKQILATMALCGLYVRSLSFMAADVGGLANAFWLPAVYSLVFSAISPLCGYLQDLFGRRNITITAGAIVIIGIIITATAHSFVPAVIGVAITGGGASPCELTALAGMSELVPVNKRGIYLAIVTFTIFPFTPFVIYCQLLGTYHTWRWMFYISIMVNSLSLAGTVVFYFPLSQTRAGAETTKSIIKKIDYIGAILSMGALTLIILALQAAGQSHAWLSAYVICNLVIGVLLAGALAMWEWKFAKFPIIPHGLFTGQRVVAMCLVICFVAGIGLFALTSSRFGYSTVFPADPVQVGLKTLGPTMANNIGAIVCNVSLSLFRKYNREVILFATVLMTVCCGTLATVTPETPARAIALGTFSSFGIGSIPIPAATLAVIATSDTTIATCVALTLCVRKLGGSIGTAVFFNVLQSRLKTGIAASVVKYAAAAGLPLNGTEDFVATYLSEPEDALKLPGVNTAIMEGAALGTRWAYAYSFKYVWYTAVGFGSGAIVACCFLGQTERFHTNRIAATVKS